MQFVCKTLGIHYMYYYVCMAFEYSVCIQRRRKRKGNFGDAPGGLAEQLGVRMPERRLVAGNFPWLMTTSSFSLLWIFFFFAFVFAAFLAFFCLPYPTSILGELGASGQLRNAELAQGTH